ncbi:MAG: Holliday junction resolvase RuvX [Pyrinomonadaceae bacterium]|nr:Holliday junction resolvase RuvX [Pyrinomonadaceae bacterium]
MQDNKTTNPPDSTDNKDAPKRGRILALDLGTKKVGIAVSDELQIAVRPVGTIKRASWKNFLKEVINYLAEYDAKALVLGLPLNSDGTESEMSTEARKIAGYFKLSLDIPVYLQDERVSTYQARGNLWKKGISGKKLEEIVDSEAAAIILEDFISVRNSQK